MVSQRAVLVLSLCSTSLMAQEITTGRPKRVGEVAREEYLRFLPDIPSFGVASRGSKEFGIYGTYVDPYLASRGKRTSTAPPAFHPNSLLPSLDSARAARLHELAVRFRPVLRRNSNSAPRSVNDLLGITYYAQGDSLACSDRTILNRDIWSVAGVAPTLADRRTIDLAVAERRRCPRGPPIEPRPMSPANDSAYQEVLFAGIEGDLHDHIESRQQVLFFDLPGRNTREWARARAQLEPLPPATYAHFFIDRVGGPDGPGSPARYDPIMQYWFFFPGNDSGNDHEGDWEHINVHITTRARAASGDPAAWFPSKVEIESILDPAVPWRGDLVISAVDYYFHHYVAILDYKPVYASTAPAAVAAQWRDSTRRDAGVLARFGHREGDTPVAMSGHVYRAIRDRISVAKGAYETRPIGYIGGSTMSVVAILKGPAHGRDQNSHGIYPLAGMWHGIGPMGAVERVQGRDPSDLELGDEFVDFGADEVRLIPDWEPLWELFTREDVVRQRWGWLILPVRWGFPVFESPLMRQIERYDFGGVGPIGPVYNPGWNRFGAGQNFHLYRVRSVSGAFQRSILDIAHPNLGVLNVPLMLFTKVPPFNGLAAHLMIGPAAAGLGPTNFEQQGGGLLTHRYSAGVVGTIGGVVRLHRRVSDSLALARADPGQAVNLAERTVSAEHGPAGYVAYEVAVGRRNVATATLRFPLANSRLRYNYPGVASGPLLVEGTVEPWDLAGELGRRIPILLSRLETRVRVGYGWTWYRYRSDHLTGEARIKGGRNPLTFWAPNSLSAGMTTDIGLFNAQPNLAEADLLQVGLRLGATAVHTRRSGFRGLGTLGLTATW